VGFVHAVCSSGVSMSLRSGPSLGSFLAKEPYRATILIVSMFAAPGVALAQTTGAVADPPTQPSSEMPSGACMPIGVTASGEVVFPLTCKTFLEQKRDPLGASRSTTTSGKLEAPPAGPDATAAIPVPTKPDVQSVTSVSSPATSSTGDDGGKKRKHAKRKRARRPPPSDRE
jgi:hypothetical protein